MGSGASRHKARKKAAGGGGEGDGGQATDGKTDPAKAGRRQSIQVRPKTAELAEEVDAPHAKERQQQGHPSGLQDAAEALPPKPRSRRSGRSSASSGNRTSSSRVVSTLDERPAHLERPSSRSRPASQHQQQHHHHHQDDAHDEQLQPAVATDGQPQINGQHASSATGPGGHTSAHADGSSVDASAGGVSSQQADNKDVDPAAAEQKQKHPRKKGAALLSITVEEQGAGSAAAEDAEHLGRPVADHSAAASTGGETTAREGGAETTEENSEESDFAYEQDVNEERGAAAPDSDTELAVSPERAHHHDHEHTHLSQDSNGAHGVLDQDVGKEPVHAWGEPQQQQQQQQQQQPLGTSRASEPFIEDSVAIFREFAAIIFRRADTNANGRLDMNEYDAVLRSPTLNLSISDADAIELFYQYDHDKDGALSFSEFEPLLNMLMCCAYADLGEEDEEWLRIGFAGDEEDALPLFFNRKTGVMTYTTPHSYISLDEDPGQQFEYFTLQSDGSIITTYVAEDGTRHYLDMETQSWHAVPSEMESDLQPLDSGYDDEGTDMWSSVTGGAVSSEYHSHGAEHGAQAGESGLTTLAGLSFDTIENPITGEQVFTCVNKEERAVRFFADPKTSQLKPLPTQWDAVLPSTEEALARLTETFPKWTNTREQVLALRINDYDVEKTVQWMREEGAFVGSDAEDDKGQGAPPDLPALRALKEKHETAQQELAELNRRVLELQARIENMDDEKASIQRDLENSRKLVERQATRIFTLEEQLDTAQRESANKGPSTEDVQQYEDKIRALEKQLQLTQQGNDEAMNKLLREQGEEMTKLRESEARLRQQLKEAQATSSSKYDRLNFELAELQQQNTLLRDEYTQSADAFRRLLSKLAIYNTQAEKRLSSAIANEEVMRNRYQKECLQRKLLYNKIQELRGNIRVFCRCRYDDRVPCVIDFVSESELLVPHPKGSKVFEFDKAYGPETTQEQVYEDTSPIITSCADGYNVCFLAYGQTGSGKTYTMMGTPDNPGVNRRAIRELFAICEKAEDIDYTMTISLMEIYNENIFDLLAGDNKPLRVRKKEGRGDSYVENLVARPVNEMQDVTNALEDGEKNRTVAATAMNIHSSRSHLLLQLTVAGVNRVTGVKSQGKLTLCDLAGSERVAKSQATGSRLVEAAAINKSLTSLGLVFQALATNSKHVPYRNSKLTHVLADSLGGQSKCCVFVNISPAESNLTETLSTLNFGQGIAKIELGPVKRNVKR